MVFKTIFLFSLFFPLFLKKKNKQQSRSLLNEEEFIRQVQIQQTEAAQQNQIKQRT